MNICLLLLLYNFSILLLSLYPCSIYQFVFLVNSPSKWIFVFLFITYLSFYLCISLSLCDSLENSQSKWLFLFSLISSLSLSLFPCISLYLSIPLCFSGDLAFKMNIYLPLSLSLSLSLLLSKRENLAAGTGNTFHKSALLQIFLMFQPNGYFSNIFLLSFFAEW